jgi:hypothetical protein
MDLFDQVWGRVGGHCSLIDARWDKGAIDTGILLIQLSAALLEKTCLFVLPCCSLRVHGFWSFEQRLE